MMEILNRFSFGISATIGAVSLKCFINTLDAINYQTTIVNYEHSTGGWLDTMLNLYAEEQMNLAARAATAGTIAVLAAGVMAYSAVGMIHARRQQQILEK